MVRGVSARKTARRRRPLLPLVALAAVTAVLLAACGGATGSGSSGDPKNAKEVHLGVILPLTGSTAQNGRAPAKSYFSRSAGV